MSWTDRLSRLRPRSATGYWILLAAAGLAGWLIAFAVSDAARVWRALLVSFLFFTSMSAGLVMWSPTMVLTRGNWAGPLERMPLSGLAFAIPSVAILGLLWAGGPTWAPWVGNPDIAWKPWLTWPAVFARDTGTLILFWAIAAWYSRRRRSSRPTWLAGWLVFVYIGVFSLLGFDLVLALALKWTSVAFGWYFLITAMYIAACAWALAAAWTGTDPERLHDVGQVLYVFSLMSTYLMYCQLLTLWYENIPPEVIFLVPRMNFGPWRWVSIALVVVIWLGPLVVLMPHRAKSTRWWLGGVAAVLLAGLWVQTWWLVEPTFYPHNLPFSLAEISGIALVGGILGATIFPYFRTLPEDLPKEPEPS